MMEPAHSQRTRPSSDTFSRFWILSLLMALFVGLVVLLPPNAPSTPQSVESWSPEPVLDSTVPVTGSLATTASFYTTPSPRTIRTGRSRGGKNRVGNKTRMPIEKIKNRNNKNKTNNNERPAVVVKNKIIVDFNAGVPLQHEPPSNSTKTAETPPRQIDGWMVASWTLCSLLLIVIVPWLAVLKVQGFRGRSYRDLLSQHC